MHESLIGVLNRRFVSCHFNAFARGVGADPGAQAFVEQHGLALRYGGVVTPDGRQLNAFGFRRDEVYRAFRDALRNNPAFDRNTPEEQTVFDRAKAEPGNAAAQRAAARLASELLRFADARRYAEAAVAAAKAPEETARSRYALGHVLALDLEDPDPAAARRVLESIGSPPADIADDVALDRIGLSVELKPHGSFFTGWRLAPGADAKAIAAELEDWIEEAPASNRIGQMHFFLGLARRALDDAQRADAIWKRHVTRYPEDRWAMLSRIHHTGYRFSPYHDTHGGLVIGGGGSLSPEMQERLKKALREGNGTVSDPELVRALLERMRKQKEEAARRQAEEDARREAAEKEAQEPSPEPDTGDG